MEKKGRRVDNELVEHVSAMPLEQVRRFILFYNSRRPHMSIGNQTPDVAHGQTGVQKKMWKDKNHCGNEQSLQINP